MSIAVVSSCGEPSQADNRLVVIPTSAFVSSDSVSNGYDSEYFGLDYLPDAYYIGLAGTCFYPRTSPPDSTPNIAQASVATATTMLPASVISLPAST